MNKPLTPPSLESREKHFKAKVANQKPLPPDVAPTPENMPRIIPDPMKKGSK
jgi:hypothetical protein